MRISSPVFQDQGVVPKRYTCEGPNISPPLTFSEIPDNTESMVLIVEDPDAPANPWVHWLVFNIPKTETTVQEGTVPRGTEGLANGGTHGYEGPCPPSGTHRYLFKLYALNTFLQLSGTANRSDVLKAMEGSILAEATLTGIYELNRY